MKSCSGKTKAGKPCRAAAGPGGLCFFHANPDTAKRLGQIGGTKNRKFTGFDMHVPDDITATDLCKVQVQILRNLLSGDLPAREATAAVQICNLLSRNLITADLERRIAVLEEKPAGVSISTDDNEFHVAENHAQDSPESRTSDTEAPEETSAGVSIPTDDNEFDVAENHAQDSPESRFSYTEAPEETSAGVSIPTDDNEFNVAENHAQDSPESRTSDTEAPDTGNDDDGEAG